MRRPPGGAVARDRRLRLVRWIEADNVKTAFGRALGAVRRMDAVPDRRVRLLQRRKLHRHVVECEMLAVEIQARARQALQDELDRLVVDTLRIAGIDAEIFDLDRRGTTAE